MLLASNAPLSRKLNPAPGETGGQQSVEAGKSRADSKHASLRPIGPFHDPTAAAGAARASPPFLHSCTIIQNRKCFCISMEYCSMTWSVSVRQQMSPAQVLCHCTSLNAVLKCLSPSVPILQNTVDHAHCDEIYEAAAMIQIFTFTVECRVNDTFNGVLVKCRRKVDRARKGTGHRAERKTSTLRDAMFSDTHEGCTPRSKAPFKCIIIHIVKRRRISGGVSERKGGFTRAPGPSQKLGSCIVAQHVLRRSMLDL